MNRFAPILILLALLFSNQSGARSEPGPEQCSDFHVRHGSFHYQRISTSDGDCFLTADPFDVTDLIYRSYLTSNDGLLMVFNSYGDFEDSLASGARVFHFFPRQNQMDLQQGAGETAMLMATPGMKLVLSHLEAKVLRLEGAVIQEAPQVLPNNKGGLEILKSDYLYLDSGFALGHDVTTEANSISIFRDTDGRTCDVKNREVFSYTSDGDSNFRFNDSELKEFLKVRCPRLAVNF